MQRIVVDARAVTVKSGIGNYIEALLQRIVPLAEDMRFLLLRPPEDRRPILRHPRVEELALPGETKSIHTFWIGRAHRFEDFDLYHGPSDIIPWGIRCPWVATIHDMIWLERPDLGASFLPTRAVLAAWYRAEYGHAIRGAERVITISRASADGIGRVFPKEAGKVRVIHHGVDREQWSPERAGSRSSIERIVPAKSRYSLIVGRGAPYKNHPGMIRAFVEATRDDPGHKLVVVRRFARLDFAMRRLLERPDVREKVVTVPSVTSDELLTLYRNAVALLFASHYEGFGMPLLEAMAMGVPVLISTDPALVEVAGGAALSAESTNHADLVAKIRRLAQDADLRASLAKAGQERASAFSWDTCARQTLEVYREAIAAAKDRR